MKKLLIFVIFAIFLLIPAFSAAISPPVLSCSTHPNFELWYNNDKPKFSWGEISGATSYRYVLDTVPDNTPDATNETTETEYQSKPKLDGEWYFHIVACAGSACSVPTHYKVRIDKNGPPAPKDIEITAVDGGFYLTWTPPEDDRSGISGYKLYRHNERNFRVQDVVPVDINENTSNYTDKADWFREGGTYFFRLTAIDGAANRGSLTLEASGKMLRYCDLNISLDFPSYTNTTSQELSVSATGGTMYSASISVVLPDGTEVILLDNQNNREVMSASYDFSGYEGVPLLVLVNSDDRLLGDNCDTNKYVVYETTAPELELVYPAANTKLKGTEKLLYSATDPGAGASGIDYVKAFYEKDESWNVIGTTSSFDGDNLYFDWNTMEVENGRYGFKVTAYDKAGNSETIETIIEVFNTASASAEASEMIDAMDAVKNQAYEFAQDLNKHNINSERFAGILQTADGNNSSARNLFSRELFDRAKTTAQAAKQLYADAMASISFAPYNTQHYVYNKELLSQSFDAVGLAPHLRAEAETLIKSSEITRTLELSEVSDQNEIYYLANVIIEFTNSDTNAISLKLVEIIPKEFASDASLISSNSQYTVLTSDPIISFSDVNVAAGETLAISYGLSGPITRQAADGLIAASMVNKFATPPLLFSAETAVDNTNFMAQTQIFSLDPETTLLIIVAVVLVIVILVLIAVIFLVLKRKPGSGAEAKQTKLFYQSKSKKLGFFGKR